MISRLIVVDQFLRDCQGHNFGYSAAVSIAAASAGLRPLIAANRRVRLGTNASITVLPWFDHPGYSGTVAPSAAQTHSQLSDLGEDLLLIAARHSPEYFRFWQSWNARRRGSDRSEPLWRGLFRTVLGRFLRGSLSQHRSAEAAPKFAEQVVQLLDTQKAGPNDHVLCHTITFAELAALLDTMVLRRGLGLPRFHIVLRNDPELDPPEYNLGECLERFRMSGLWPARVRFYSDTANLVRLYERASSITFGELPIPLLHAAANGPVEDSEIERPIHAVYLGDARVEKGYHWLPAVAFDLWPDLVRTNRLRLTFQSNFNVPGGEAGICEAQNQLAQFPGDKVQLLTEPLSNREYQCLIRAADIILVPYDPLRYRARSSGVVAEALALGKPLVIPAGTWMATQVPSQAAETFEAPTEIAAALRRAVGRHSEMAETARAFASDWKVRHNATSLVRVLLGDGGEAALPSLPPAILYIMDADAFVFKTGSCAVARNQLAYLARCGYRVFGVFLSMDVSNPRYDEAEWRENLAQALPPGVLTRHWLLTYRPGARNMVRALAMLRDVRAGRYSLERAMSLYDGLDIPHDLIRFAQSGSVAGVFLNYIAGYRLLERLGANRLPVLCETHDIQAFHYAHYGRRPVDPPELGREYELLDRCRAVIALSDLEAEKLSGALKSARVFDIRPPIDVSPVSERDLLGGLNLGDIVRSCGLSAEREEIARRLAEASHLDLLFVSTLHWPNVASFRWFYEKVYLPHLAERGVTIAIAGNIDRMLCDIEHPCIFKTGGVDDLRPLYAAARLVVLPMRIGAGFSIKTMEAVAYGKPIVATRFALRGLEYSQDRVAVADDPDEFAAEIVKLLSSPTARRMASRASLDVALTGNRPDRYDLAMNDACRTAWGDGLPAVIPREEPLPGASLRVEWSPTAQHLNRILVGLPLNDSQRLQLRVALIDPEQWTFAEALYVANGRKDFASFAAEHLGIRKPSSTASTAGPRYRGQVEGLHGPIVTGWAVDWQDPSRPVQIILRENERTVATGLANRPRSDLRWLEIGLGTNGFGITLPKDLVDGREHVIQVGVANSGFGFPGAPLTVKLAPADAVIGNVDGLTAGHVCGWAWNPVEPSVPVRISVIVDGVEVCCTEASSFRADLLTAKIGVGFHAFSVPLPVRLLNGKEHAIEVVVAGTDKRLPGAAGLSAGPAMTSVGAR